jgi:hypothetical protein
MLRRAKLTGANLIGANLSKALLPEADLSLANLSEANLCAAHLEKVNLNKANLPGANLAAGIDSGGFTILSEANLSLASGHSTSWRCRLDKMAIRYIVSVTLLRFGGLSGSKRRSRAACSTVA